MFDVEYHSEKVHPSVWVAPGAVVVGDVTLEADVSVWFQSVLRGDTESLHVGARTNIQEGCVFHADPGYPLVVGKNVTVGHGAIIHGANVGDNSLIGIRSTLLNGVVIGEESMVGAGALCTPNKVFPPRSLILGVPAKVVRELTDEDLTMIRVSVDEYVEKAATFKSQANK